MKERVFQGKELRERRVNRSVEWDWFFWRVVGKFGYKVCKLEGMMWSSELEDVSGTAKTTWRL